MAISTIYEVDKSATKRFYAVERAGFTDVGDMVRSVINDMINDQWFTLTPPTNNGQNLISKLTDVNNFIMSTPEWPVLERLVQLANSGVGFNSTNVIDFPLPVEPNVKIQVGNVDPYTGSIVDFRVLWPGNYFSAPVSNSLGRYATLKNPPTAAANVTVNFESFAAAHRIYGNVTNSVGLPLVNQTPSLNITDPKYHDTNGDPTVGNYTKEHGAPGTLAAPLGSIFGTVIPPLGGAAAGSRKTQPTGLWFVKAPSTANKNITINANVFIGQTIGFDPRGPKAANSAIPPNTRIVSVGEFKYINTVTQKQDPVTQTKFLEESLADGIWFTVDKQVTISMTDAVLFYGSNVAVRTTSTQYPKAWQTTVEASGGVDPINDPYGVEADVVSTTTNSRYFRVTSMTTAANYPAEIYAGQQVTSTLVGGGSIGEDAVFVELVTMESASIANVKINMPKSMTAAEPLLFKFPQLQPWRLAFQVQENTRYPSAGPQSLNIFAATEIQLQNNGNIANIWLPNIASNVTTLTAAQASALTYEVKDLAGIMGDLPSGANAAINANVTSEGFLNRSSRVGTSPEAYPLNYGLTMTERGIFFGLWEGTWSTLQKRKVIGAGGDNYFNWFLIQRPVDRYTGKTLTRGRCPVFCLNSVGYKYWKFIVREEDVLHPSIGDRENIRETWDYANSKIVTTSTSYRVPADANTQDSFALLNTTNQVALTEDSKYLVSFIHNLATPRFRYSEELDMIGQTSADVCMAGNDISINAYNETGNRIYRALPANNPYNTGLRIAVLRDIP